MIDDVFDFHRCSIDKLEIVAVNDKKSRLPQQPQGLLVQRFFGFSTSAVVATAAAAAAAGVAAHGNGWQHEVPRYT